MSLMSRGDQEKLARRFALEMSGEVRVHLRMHATECVLCAQTGELLREVASLASGLSLSTDTGDGSLPDIRLEGAARGEVRFVGLPSGYEFPALIDSIVDVSTGRTTLSAETLARLSAITRPVHLQVFTTPT